MPSAKVELSDAEEKRARAILDREQIVSMHDHTSIFPEDMGRVLEQRRQGRDATGYAGLPMTTKSTRCAIRICRAATGSNPRSLPSSLTEGAARVRARPEPQAEGAAPV